MLLIGLEKIFDHVYNQFLLADMNIIGAGHPALEQDLKHVHNTTLSQAIVIQMDELLDISASMQDQFMNKQDNLTDTTLDEDEEESEAQRLFQEAVRPFEGSNPKTNTTTTSNNYSANRMLKLSCTDGKSRIFAMEYRPVPALSVNTQPGCKICIKGVLVKRGMLMLIPACVCVLGGSVAELVEANKVRKDALAAKLAYVISNQITLYVVVASR